MSGKVSLEIPLGTDWEKTLLWSSDEDGDNPQDIRNYTARMDIRRKASSENYLARLTTENGGITLGGLLGTIILTLPNAVTSAFPPGEAIGQLEMINASSKVARLLEIKFTLTQEATR